jgi:hypothetical protein
MTPAEKLRAAHEKDYSQIPFDEFVELYRSKYYTDMSTDEFKTKTGLSEPASAPQPTKARPASETVSTIDYALDQAKIGFADFLINLLPREELLLTDFTKYKYGDPESMAKLEEDMRLNREAARQAITAPIGGIQGLQPQSRLQSVLGTAAYEVGSEGPLAFIGARGPVSALTELGYSYGISAAGALGSELSVEAARGFGAGETLQQAAGIIGGGAVAAGPSIARGAVNSTLRNTGGAVSDFQTANKELKASVDKATDFVTTSEMKQVIKRASEAQPDIADVIKATTELEKNVPGVVIPPFAVLADNPIYRKNTEELIRSNPEFYKQSKEAIRGVNAALEKRTEQLFGKSGALAEAAIQERLPKDFGVKLNNATKRIEAVDNQIAKLTSTLRPDADFIRIGEQVEGLIRAKEQSVRDKLSPQYTRLIEDADRAGIALPKESVQNIYNFVGLARQEDLFASFPEINQKIQANFRPKDVPIETIMGEDVSVRDVIRTGRRTVKVFEPASLKDLDSLKRAVNLAIRRTKDDNTLRNLGNLKRALETEVVKLPAEFSVPYKSLDAQYYAELGMPMSAAGVRQLDAARFQTQAGTYLARAEQARDFLNLVGEAGVPVVKDAVLLNIANRVIDGNGNFNAKAFNKILETDRNLINSIPNFRQELTNLSTSIRAMEQTKARMNVEYTKYAKEQTDGFYKAFDARGLDGVVTDILNSPGKRAKYLSDISKFTPDTAQLVRQGIRAQLLERAINTTGTSTLDFIKDNKNAFESVFGSRYLENVQSIGELYDIINKVDLDGMKFALSYKDADALQEKTGISAVQLQSILRDRITNFGTKIAIIWSKISTSSIKDKRNSQMMELLLNPNALEQLKRTTDAQKLNLTTPEGLSKFTKIINESVTKGIYFATQAAEEQAARQEEEPMVQR